MYRLRSLRAALAVVTAVLLIAGCGSMFREPKITLENVRVGGLGLQGGTLLVSLQVENPNSFNLSSEALKYQLSVRDPSALGDTVWVDFASGSFDEPFTVRGGETKAIEIPVEFNYAGLGGASSSILRNGTFTYRALGSVDVHTPIGTRSVPFQKRGTVTMLGGT
jgi:LEA14-like dessication related protein